MKEKEREKLLGGKKPVKVKSLGQYESLLPNLALPKTCLRRHKLRTQYGRTDHPVKCEMFVFSKINSLS